MLVKNSDMNRWVNGRCAHHFVLIIWYQKLLLCIYIVLTLGDVARAQENASPSVHLSYAFDSEAVLKMQKIKIVNSAFTTYFEVNSFIRGYCGLQQTTDKIKGVSNIFISSLWNLSDSDKARIDYIDPKTIGSRFGGEGDGAKTMSPYNWQPGIWYNVVNRAWKSEGRMFVATYINNLETGEWFHTATFSNLATASFLGKTNDAFIENWDGNDPRADGRYLRKAFFKDCWNISVHGVWEKNTRAYFSANNSDADIKRNGRYNDSFNAFYDPEEDAYCMQSGSSETKPAIFGDKRTIALPIQKNQGSMPKLPEVLLDSLTAFRKNNNIELFWSLDPKSTPQFSVKIEIIDDRGNLFKSFQDTLPQRRSFKLNGQAFPKNAKVYLTVFDIFNQQTPSVSCDIISEEKRRIYNYIRSDIKN